MSQPDHWRVGDVRITPILELIWTLDDPWLIPEATPQRLAEHAAWLRPHYVTDRDQIVLYIQSLVIESSGARIVVDTCIGNDKPRRTARFDRMQTPWLETLTDAGFSPASIDAVLCTHLHFDHVGWNTRLESGRWVPTFPDARYLIGAQEWAHARDSQRDHIEDSVRPIFDAGLVDLIEAGHHVTPEVFVAATPGHTPGHVSVHIHSKGARAVITGDMIHHPSQCAHPEWRCAADGDPVKGSETRRRFLASVADSPTLVIGTHFAAPSGGRVLRDGDAWRFEPA